MSPVIVPVFGFTIGISQFGYAQRFCERAKSRFTVFSDGLAISSEDYRYENCRAIPMVCARGFDLRSANGECGAESGEKLLANRSRSTTPAAEPQTEAGRSCGTLRMLACDERAVC